MKLKPGVPIDKLTMPMSWALMILRDVAAGFGVILVITSGCEGESGDGVHGEGSLHYSGEAVDVRTRDLPVWLRKPFRAVVAYRLGGSYDVVLESTHLHVEHDPGIRASRPT